MKTLKLWLWVFLLCLGFSARLDAVTPLDLARQAEKNYQSEQYAKAVQDYKTLSEIGFVNGDLYNNLASAYWRMGEVGESRLYFLKAQDLLPRDISIHANLAYIGDKLEQKKPANNPLQFLQKIPLYRLSLNFSESLWISAISSLAASLIFLLSLLKNKAWLRFAGLFLLFPLLWGIVFLTKNLRDSVLSPRAVVLTAQVHLLKAPTLDAKSDEIVEAGMILQIKKMQGDFALVKTTTDKEGWIAKKDFGEI